MSNSFPLTKNNAHDTIWAMATKSMVDNKGVFDNWDES